MPQQFASDNNAGLCPAALEALIRANAEGHAPGYGDDAWSIKACGTLRGLFEKGCEVFCVFNGPAANGWARAQLCRPYPGVIAPALSHVEPDEGGAGGFFPGGARVMTANTPLGKLTAAAVEELVGKGRGAHAVKPRALPLTQATELGTVYTPDALGPLSTLARRHD